MLHSLTVASVTLLLFDRPNWEWKQCEVKSVYNNECSLPIMYTTNSKTKFRIWANLYCNNLKQTDQTTKEFCTIVLLAPGAHFIPLCTTSNPYALHAAQYRGMIWKIVIQMSVTSAIDLALTQYLRNTHDVDISIRISMRAAMKLKHNIFYKPDQPVSLPIWLT